MNNALALILVYTFCLPYFSTFTKIFAICIISVIHGYRADKLKDQADYVRLIGKDVAALAAA
jgi:hypothetical protein